MRISWKRQLSSEMILSDGTPPLGLMRISWKLIEFLQFFMYVTPPLGLMRISWKPSISIGFIGLSGDDPPAWVNAD